MSQRELEAGRQTDGSVSADLLDDFEEESELQALYDHYCSPGNEQAIAAHENNVHHIGEGIYDSWVNESYKQLAKLLPIRYAKTEKSEQYNAVIH